MKRPDDCATISVPEAGRRLGVGRCTAYELARIGHIPALRLGKKLRVPVAALEQLLRDAYWPRRAASDAAMQEELPRVDRG